LVPYSLILKVDDIGVLDGPGGQKRKYFTITKDYRDNFKKTHPVIILS